MASYGPPRFLDALRELVRATGDGGFAVEPVDWAAFAPALRPGGELDAPRTPTSPQVQRAARGGAARPRRAGCTRAPASAT